MPTHAHTQPTRLSEFSNEVKHVRLHCESALKGSRGIRLFLDDQCLSVDILPLSTFGINPFLSPGNQPLDYHLLSFENDVMTPWKAVAAGFSFFKQSLAN